jgi:hypothetical protein
MKHIDGGIRDQLEHYNSALWRRKWWKFLSFMMLVNRDVTKREHPEAVRQTMPEVAAFARHNHFNVLHPILRYV